MYRVVNTCATGFVLAGLVFSIIAVDSNFWIVEGRNNFGLFEDCQGGKCQFHQVPILTNLTIALICVSVFTWCATFVCCFLKFFKETKFMKLAITVFSIISVGVDLIGCLTYTIEYEEHVSSSGAEWGYSFICAWCATAAGTIAVAFNIYILRLPLVVRKKPPDTKVSSVSEKVPCKDTVQVHMEKLKPPAEGATAATPTKETEASTAL